MSADEGRQQEAKSSIAVSTTASGKPLVTVKIYDGAEEDEITRIREMAVAAYKSTAADVGVPV